MFCSLGLILIICAVSAVWPVVAFDAPFERDLNPTRNSVSSISGSLKPAKKPTDSIDGDLNLKKKKKEKPRKCYLLLLFESLLFSQEVLKVTSPVHIRDSL